MSFGPKIRKSVEAHPDDLLLHENLLFSLFPPHAGMRQYWRDFDSLERAGPGPAAPAVVAAVLAGQGRHRLLARDLLRRRPD